MSKDWSSLPNFQRTRGVLRFMANVVSVLWQARARDPMILPAMQLQRGNGAKVKLTLKIEAENSDGFDEADIGVVRDNARQLKLKPESTDLWGLK